MMVILINTLSNKVSGRPLYDSAHFYEGRIIINLISDMYIDIGKRESYMKVLSTIVTIQGLVYIYGSIISIFNGNMFEVGTYSLGPYFHIMGIVLGLSLVIAGIGLWFQKRYSYYLTIIIYFMLTIYGGIAVVYLLIVNEIVPMLLVILFLIYSFIIINYTWRRKIKFK